MKTFVNEYTYKVFNLVDIKNVNFSISGAVCALNSKNVIILINFFCMRCTLFKYFLNVFPQIVMEQIKWGFIRAL